MKLELFDTYLLCLKADKYSDCGIAMRLYSLMKPQVPIKSYSRSA